MTGSRVLVVGGGGREHALVWALRQSPSVAEVAITPGNGAVPGLGVAANDIAGIVQLAADYDFVVVGPEEPLSLGLADALVALGKPTFGPSAAAARIESSKAFAKEVMEAAGVPTARWATVRSHAEGVAWLDTIDFQVVVKASGLAAGKGVFVCDSREDAEAALWSLFVDQALGEAGAEVVLEERLSGEEISLLALCDGTHHAVFPAAQDHKRLLDGDQGPNTGGMGAYAPAPAGVGLEVMLARQVIAPILHELSSRGTPFRGVLYAGLMMTPDGPRVLEYNARFGDPEAQVLLPLLDEDLYPLLVACASGRLPSPNLKIRAGAAVTVVAAAEGYPVEPRKGDTVRGANDAETIDGVTVFFAGVSKRGFGIATSGGRVLAVTAVADDLPTAVASAYAGIDKIEFDGIQFRRDIAQRALARRKEEE